MSPVYCTLVCRYVPEWPEKVVDGSVVSLTVRQLCCHMAGVRHYDRKDEQAGEQEFLKKEYYIKEHFSTTDESLELFKDDELLHAPGTKCCYTTHGFTLLAKVDCSGVGSVQCCAVKCHVFTTVQFVTAYSVFNCLVC